MSIPNEALQRLFAEIEQKAAISTQQIAVVKAQIAAKGREGRMIQLTTSELDSLPQNTNVYEGVGKMFVLSPLDVTKAKLATQATEVKTETSNLEKKLHYLETTAKNSREHIENMLKGGAR